MAFRRRRSFRGRPRRRSFRGSRRRGRRSFGRYTISRGGIRL